MKVWDANREVYRPEMARTTFFKAKLLFTRNDVKEVTEASKEAGNRRRKVKHAMPKEKRDLVEEGFDSLVTFWSR